MKREVDACQYCTLNPPCVRSFPAFAELAESEMQALIRLARQYRFAKHANVFTEGEISKGLILLRRGQIKLLRYGFDGEEVVVDILGHGDIYGGDEIFVEQAYPETGIAIEEVGICLIRKEDVRMLVLERPEIGLKITEYLNQKLLQSRGLLEIICTRDSLRKVALFLESYARRSPSAVLELSQADIAHSINLTKETVNRKLAELQKQGLIEVKGKRKIHIPCLENLRRSLV